MSDMMTFPDTWEEFEKLYGFNDGEEIYTNNSRLIPSFRVKQWLDHLPSVQPEFSNNSKELEKNSKELENKNGELISRQAAIGALDEIEAEVADGYGYQYAKWREYFVEMPSAQPKPCEDAVSRQAVKNAICDYVCAPDVRCVSNHECRMKQLISELPPAQPEQLEQCPIYGGMCAYPSDQCYDCPRHAGAKMEVAT